MKKIVLSISIGSFFLYLCSLPLHAQEMLVRSEVGSRLDSIKMTYEPDEQSVKGTFETTLDDHIELNRLNSPNARPPIPVNTPTSVLSITAVALIEGAAPKYTLPGIGIFYTKFINPRWGVAGDGGIYIGKKEQVNYTRTSLMGGFSYYLDVLQENGVMIIPYALAGINTIATRRPAGEGKNSQVAVGLAFGTLATYELKNSKLLTFKIDYNPSFAQGFTIRTLRIGAGLSFLLGD